MTNEVEQIEEKPSHFKKTLTYEDLTNKQKEFVDLVLTGVNVNLIGAAGSGKTAALRVALEMKLARGDFTPVAFTTKAFRNQTDLNCTFGTFTRRATKPLRAAVPEALKHLVSTFHNLTEYSPVGYEVTGAGGETRNLRRFEPQRNKLNTLPPLNLLVGDEAGQIGLTLWSSVTNALADFSSTQIILLGDLFQLPPVQDSPVLGYSLAKNKTVVLDKVHRQAEESPIIRFADRVLSGERFTDEELDTEWKTYRPWVNILRVKPTETAQATSLAFFGSNNGKTKSVLHAALDSGEYNPFLDVILTAQNYEALGQSTINAHIASMLDAKLPDDFKAKYPLTRIMAGRAKLLFRVGDKVLFNGEDYYITDIEENPHYMSAKGIDTSVYDRFGRTLEKHALELPAGALMRNALDKSGDGLLDYFEQAMQEEESKSAASHKLTLTYYEDGVAVAKQFISQKTELDSIQLGYCITGHKSQGSQWRNVYVVCHQVHAKTLTREWLYTTCTRPTEKLYILGTTVGINKAIARKAIKGETVEEKIEVFKQKTNFDKVMV